MCKKALEAVINHSRAYSEKEEQVLTVKQAVKSGTAIISHFTRLTLKMQQEVILRTEHII